MKRCLICLLFFALCACGSPVPSPEPLQRPAAAPAAGQSSGPAGEEGQAEASAPFQYARGFLEPDGQAVYDGLYQAALRLDTAATVPVPSSLSDAVAEQIARYFYDDNPAFFWAIPTLRAAKGGGREFYFALQDDITPQLLVQKQQEINQAAAEILSRVDGNGMDAVIRIHDLLAGRIYYNRYSQKTDKANLYGGLVLGEAICDGYTKSFHYLLQQKGIPAIYISGTSGRGIPHSWCAVELEGNWYYIDLAWNDPGSLRHDYLGLSLEEINLEHRWDVGQYPSLPASESRDYDYFIYKGYAIDPAGSADLNTQFSQAFARQLATLNRDPGGGAVLLEVKILGTAEEYRQVKDHYVRELFPILRQTGQLLATQRPDLLIAEQNEVACNFNDTLQVVTLSPQVTVRG